jgi:hypothetical protein
MCFSFPPFFHWHVQSSKPVQQKQENPSDQPKSPQSEQETHNQEKKKRA